jgi:hypothetical protein
MSYKLLINSYLSLRKAGRDIGEPADRPTAAPGPSEQRDASFPEEERVDDSGGDGTANG